MKNIKYRILICTFSFIANAFVSAAYSQNVPEFSTAGFFQTKNSGREVYSLNPVWAFYKGDIKDACQKEFDDTNWKTVNLPDGIELLPVDASGCINYQGIVWYRKHITFGNRLKGKKFCLYFEAIMGKSEIYFNGKLMEKHYGGYLPVSIDITDEILWEKDNVIAVKADNSNDPSYPPGKSQETLDFAYFGGIYRDCWLITHNNVYISDPVSENITGGGGLSIAYDHISEKSADILLSLHVKNDSTRSFSGNAIFRLIDKQGNIVAEQRAPLNVKKRGSISVKKKISLVKPALWSPESPHLYNLYIELHDYKNNIIDGYRQRIGIRSIEFKGKDGFWLNGKPYGKPLIGANRHQDFAVIGNALSNSLHWRDAYKLRSAGMRVIRNAHCPQDPAFMDACDEIGLFVIVNTPGWQFWNDAPEFKERVYSDIRNMVRRDRNHACVWLWEPILNETWYPADFAQNAQNTVHEEYPYKYCYTACDNEAKGSEYFPVLFSHPSVVNNKWGIKQMNPEISYFTREWGDNVDDWNSQNSPSRVARSWGETPMLIQARHYASPSYPYTSYNALYSTSPQHTGGCLWHSFDHQRGYHPDPFYGGIMDAFRQPKYAYYMFMSQRDIQGENKTGTGPMVYIAHEMTPFSEKDVTVYSNCGKVVLTINKNGKRYTYQKENIKEGMPSPIITFENVYDFMVDKHMSMEEGRQNEVYLLAEGYIDGKLVASHKVAPARRGEEIELRLDSDGVPFYADGSDMVTVIASITDKNGNIKHLNNNFIHFEIEGEGILLARESDVTNPAPIRWGTAPVIVRSTTTPGKIKIKASILKNGKQTPISGSIEFNSIKPERKMLFDTSRINKSYVEKSEQKMVDNEKDLKIEQLTRELNNYKLKEVERQQKEFGEKNIQ